MRKKSVPPEKGYAYEFAHPWKKILRAPMGYCCAAGATLPVVTLVLGGDGLKTIDQVRDAVRAHRPVVIVKGSSRVPTLLAELFYVLEDKVPRSLLLPYCNQRPMINKLKALP